MTLTVDICGYDKLEVAGGPLVWLMRLPTALREQGLTVRIRLLSWHDPPDGVVFQCLHERGFDVSGRKFGDTESNVEWLVSGLFASPPDVFVSNLVTPAFFAARWARSAGIPTVGILHSDDDFYQAIQTEFVFGQPRYAVNSIVCVSRELERQVACRNPEHTSVARIGYGVPTPKLTARREESRLRIGYVGRFAEEQKRISEVARAFCRVTKEVPGTEAVMFGDGPDRQNVEQIMATAGAGLPVRLAGNVAPDRVQQRLVDECDVIVLLSDYEGLPISLLEAMACGVVPVCLDIRSGVSELIENDRTGLLVENRGAAFVDAIRRLRYDHQLWQRLSRAARQRVRKENSLAFSAGKWAKLLRSLREASVRRRRVELPTRWDLPAQNPALALHDPRRVASSGSFRKRLPRLARSIRRAFSSGDRE